jgi:hypothetical protein
MRNITLFGALLLGTAAAAQATPTVWESDFGASFLAGDDQFTTAGLGFAFPIFGATHTSVEVNTNGIISFAPGTGVSLGLTSADLLASNPRLAVQSFDMVTAVYLNTSVAGRAVFTWSGSEYSVGTPVTTQAQLFSDGRMILGFDGPGVPIRPILTGLSEGGGATDPGGSNLSGGSFSTGNSFYESFALSSFDLNEANLFLTPGSSGGFTVSTLAPSIAGAVPEPESWAMLTIGFGLAGAMLRRRRTRPLAA